MFQDSNNEYTGSGAGVAGSSPATPVSLSAAQEASVQSAALAALQQLRQRRTITNVEATQAQLYELARQTIAAQQGALDVTRLVDQWQSNIGAGQLGGSQNFSDGNTGKAIPAENSSEGAHDVPASPDSAGVDQSDSGSGKTPGQVAVGGDENETEQSAGPQATSESSLEESAENESGEGFAVVQPGPENDSVVAPVVNQGDSTNEKTESSIAQQGTNPTDGPARAVPPAGNEESVPGISKSGAPEAQLQSNNENPTAPTRPSSDQDEQSLASPEERGQVAHPNHGPEESKLESGAPGGSQYKQEGLPTGTRDRFKRGFEDRKSGQSFKDAYSARKLPSGGSAVKGVGEGAAKGAAESLAKEGAKDVAATAAKTAAKEGVKDTAKLASKTTPVGLLTDIDAKGAYKAAKDLKNFKVVSAAKGVTQSAAVTLFRVSYDPWVIGFTVGLSLIVTLIVGSVIFLMPSSSMTFLERLLVVALWLLLGLAVVLVLGLLLVGLCNGPQGWAIWGASFFSKTAADINKFCEPIGALQAATKNIAR